MSYQISVPLISLSAERMGLEAHLKELERLNATRVMLSIGCYRLSEKARKKEFEALRRTCAFYKSHGYEVGAWLWTFNVPETNDYMPMKGVSGAESRDFVCPSDERFRRMAGEYLADVARCGVDLILFDDDFRYGTLPHGLGCVCDNHLAYMEKELGEPIDRTRLPELLVSGDGNKYRDAWQKSKRHYFEIFAHQMREAVDAVDPRVRIGVCACITVWDVDGIDAASIARLLAGNTRPFLRLIGAPYWAENRSWGRRIQNIIELERMERSWCPNDMEILSEGDVYPRPRTACPAAYLELFDTALRVSGNMSGILKYAIDYNSKPGYETGYIERHERNRALYEAIEAHFDGKTSCGVRVYECMEKFASMRIPHIFDGNGDAENVFFSPAAVMLADNSVPTVYEGEGVCGVAFAENVLSVPREAFKKGLILDCRAAVLLSERGVDVGLVSVGEGFTAEKEYFEAEDDYTASNAWVYDISVSDNAEVLSRFITCAADCTETRRTVGSYFYENADGERFLVFAFDGYEQYYSGGGMRGYYRSAMLRNACVRFGAALPAYSYGHPDLYLQAKRGADGSLSVGLWNMFADAVFEPTVELDGSYSAVEGIGCTARLAGDRVILSDIAPFSFAGFTVKP